MGEGSASNAARPPTLPPRTQADHPALSEAPPPATLFKQKVRWSLDFLGVKKDDGFVRACVFEELDASHVKGDDGGDGFLGELDETGRETAGRVEAEAFQEDLRDDILFNDDVIRGEVDKASDAFVAASIRAAESLEEEGVLRGRKKVATIDLEKVAVEGATSLESKADVDEELAVDIAPRASGETVRFGQLFPTIELADAFCRSNHSPMCQVSGIKSNSRVMVCCALSSAMPRRTLASERKRKRATGGEGGEGDDDEDDPSEGASARAKRPQGSRAETFFREKGCHGMVQVCALACLPCATPRSRTCIADMHRGLAPRPHHDTRFRCSTSKRHLCCTAVVASTRKFGRLSGHKWLLRTTQIWCSVCRHSQMRSG